MSQSNQSPQCTIALLETRLLVDTRLMQSVLLVDNVMKVG